MITSRSVQLIGVALSAGMLAACGHAKHTASHASHPPSAAVSSTAPPPPPPINPFTGGPPSANPVVAAKIDDTGNGRPQVGIDKADLVYIEQVEGGLTRLVAVFDSSLPTVEAVRSTRANDPELMAQFGPVAYVASGGAPNPLQVLAASSLKASINDRGGPGFSRDPNRPVPYNLAANLAEVGKVLKGPRAVNIGLTWSSSAADLAADPAASTVRTMVGGTPVRFDYVAAANRWVRVIDGAPQRAADGALISTPNVIVQFCSVTPYPADVDVMGNVAKFTHTIGTGRVVVFRNGRRIEGTWSRPKLHWGTTYTTKSGAPLALAPGGAWVVLVATNAPLS